MKRSTTAVLAVLALALSFAAFAGEEKKAPLKKVDPSKVCMINEQFMDKEQIPVKVDGKTYYGCCEMCKKALASDASKRVAIDPVSLKEVDKAKAVIGADEKGKVHYFENEENLRKFRG